jgi:hypothetical protein
MLDRQKVETVLSRRFPGATAEQIAAAANAIMGLDAEWEQVRRAKQPRGAIGGDGNASVAVPNVGQVN